MKRDMESKQVWEQFLKNESIVEKEEIKKEIISSWHYCKGNDVNPYDGTANCILDLATLTQKKNENTLLLQLAKPYIKQLENLLKGWRYITTITDRDGYILLEKGERSVQKEAGKINFAEGSKWVEDEVGTNAIGLALRLQKSITVMGYEHYSRASQQWNCTAAPIFGHNGEVIGVFNVSSLYRSINYNYILACIQLAANSISLAWNKQVEQDMRILKQPSWIAEGNTIVCLFNDVICSMSKNLSPDYQQFIGRSITRLTQKTDVMIAGSRVPITYEGRIIGYRIPVSIPEKPSNFYFKGVIGTSNAFQTVLSQVEKVSTKSTAVHLFGETGSGKELIAQSIHENSLYAQGPFVTVNCGAVPESLMASELFGYEHGAFTGASHQGNKGKLELADGGTLFLDEIEEMPTSMQVLLLRALQDKKIIRIGGSKEITLDFRIITASNQDIRNLVKQRKFREDLFYRIYVFPITVPPLRERQEDIQYMIKQYLRTNNWSPSWQEDLEKVFSKAIWKGNVRELFNALERCEILYRDENPTKKELRELVSVIDPVTSIEETDHSYRFTEKIEMENIKQELIQQAGDVIATAEALEISRATLYRKMKKYKL